MPSTTGKLLLVIPLFLAAVFYWIILRPSRWLVAFFFCLLLLPPLPLPLGNSGVHVAPLFAMLGAVAALVWKREWGSWSHPLTLALAIFCGVLLESLAFAAIFSGWQIALGSLARVILFAISIFVFLYAYAGPRSDGWNPFRITKFLFGLAVVGALFACADFYFQFPAPAGYGDQFVYLEEGVFRRAQGLFYEASTLGNFCAFFLVMIMVCLFKRREETPLVARRVAGRRIDTRSGPAVFLLSRLGLERGCGCRRIGLHVCRTRSPVTHRVAGSTGRCRRRDSSGRAQVVRQLLGPTLRLV